MKPRSFFIMKKKYLSGIVHNLMCSLNITVHESTYYTSQCHKLDMKKYIFNVIT